MDGLRKVPENIPNDKILHQSIETLTDIPDPFKKYKSFGEHNNNMLIEFLKNLNLTLLLKVRQKIIKKVFLMTRFSES